MQLESLGRGELFVGYVLIAFDLDIFDQSLRTLLYFEGNVDLGFVIDGAGTDFHFFIAVIVIERLDVLGALMQQLLGSSCRESRCAIS